MHGEKKWRFICRYIILVDNCLWSQTLSKTTVVVPCLLDNTVQFWKEKLHNPKAWQISEHLLNTLTFVKVAPIYRKTSKEELQRLFCWPATPGTSTIFFCTLHTHQAIYSTDIKWVNYIMYSKYQTWCISRYTFCGRYHFDMRRKKNDAPSAISFLKSSCSNQVPICRHHRTNSIVAGFVRTHLAYTYWWLDTTTSFKVPCMAQTLGCLTDDWLAKPFEHMSIR